MLTEQGKGPKESALGLGKRCYHYPAYILYMAVEICSVAAILIESN